jgi:phosphoglycerol transferase MdoB-like AlkP superfamily enzyme
MGDPTIPVTPDPQRKSAVWLWSQILSLIEIPGILLAAYIFIYAAGSQVTYTGPDAVTNSLNNQPLYLSLFLYLATLASIVALVIIVMAFFQNVANPKLRFLVLGNELAALFLGIGTAGAIFLNSVWAWTRDSTYGGGYSSAPTANAVITQLLLSVASGAAVAILPAIVVFLLRRGQSNPS